MTEQHRCPEEGCGQTFTLARALQRHLHQTHGHPSYRERLASGEIKEGARSNLNGDDPIVSEPDSESERLKWLALPLRQSIEGDEARLLELENERQQLMARIRPVKAAITALLREHAKPGPSPKSSSVSKIRQSKQVTETSIERVSEFIEQHRDELEPDFDNAQLNRLMRANGEGMNISDMRRTVRVLHERGMIRLVSADGPGGRKTFALLPSREAFVDRVPEQSTP